MTLAMHTKRNTENLQSHDLVIFPLLKEGYYVVGDGHIAITDFTIPDGK